MVIELKKRDANLLSDILADYLDNIAADNTVIKSCEILLAKLGHYNYVRDFHDRFPLPSLEELLQGGVKPSIARRDRKTMNSFYSKLEIIDAAFRLAHQKRVKLCH